MPAVLGKLEHLAEMKNHELAVSFPVVSFFGIQAAHTCCDGSRSAAMIGEQPGSGKDNEPGSWSQLQSVIASFFKNVDPNFQLPRILMDFHFVSKPPKPFLHSFCCSYPAGDGLGAIQTV